MMTKINDLIKHIELPQFITVININSDDVLYSGSVCDWYTNDHFKVYENKKVISIKAIENGMIAIYVLNKGEKICARI